MTVNVVYSTTATATGGRDGRAETHDGAFSVALSTPKELGGAGGAGNNPEQLFAAGYEACFLGAMTYVASQNATYSVPEDTTVTSTVGIGPREQSGFGLTVSLTISLPSIATDMAKSLIDAAHEVCPYSNATRNNIDVGLVVAS